jgi:hypothetical protein
MQATRKPLRTSFHARPNNLNARPDYVPAGPNYVPPGPDAKLFGKRKLNLEQGLETADYQMGRSVT